MSKTFEVPIYNDHLREGDEAITVTLSSASAGSIGDATASITITDDEIASPSASTYSNLPDNSAGSIFPTANGVVNGQVSGLWNALSTDNTITYTYIILFISIYLGI